MMGSDFVQNLKDMFYIDSHYIEMLLLPKKESASN